MTRSSNNLRFSIFLLAALSACSGEFTSYKVDGVDVAFCVPNEFKVATPEWLPANSRDTPSGFAFKGCWDSPFDDRKTCGLPAAVVSGTVASRARYPGRRWQDIPEDAFYRQLISEPDTKIAQTDSESIVIASNTRLWDSWYVWRKAGVSSGQLTLNDGDELLVACKSQTVKPKDQLEVKTSIFCERSVEAPQYSFNYRFESKERVPQDLDSLDAQVRNRIDSWHCKK